MKKKSRLFTPGGFKNLKCRRHPGTSVASCSAGPGELSRIGEKGSLAVGYTPRLISKRVNIEPLAQSCLKKVPIWNIARARYTEPLSCRKLDFSLLLRPLHGPAPNLIPASLSTKVDPSQVCPISSPLQHCMRWRRRQTLCRGKAIWQEV